MHLEPAEAEVFMKVWEDAQQAKIPLKPEQPITYMTLSLKLGKKITTLLEEEPELLKERTPEEIKHELETEFESAKLKLAALKKGKDWKEIHVK